MARPLSRRLVVRAFVRQLADGSVKPAALCRSLAAYLIETRQTKQLDLFLADIARELSTLGIATAQVTTAHALAASTRQAIEQFIAAETGARRVDLEQHQDPHLIGGLQLSFNGQELDTSVRTKLNQLQA